MSLRRGVSGWLRVLLPLISLSVTAAASNIEDVPCSVIVGVWYALRMIGPLILGVMFVYGGAKYVFSADNPGARKQGLTICLQVIIAGILLGLAVAIVTAAGITGWLCPDFTIK